MDINTDQVIMNDATRYVFAKLAKDRSFHTIYLAKQAVEEGMPPSWLAGRLMDSEELPMLKEEACAKYADWLHIAETLYMGALNERRRDELEKMMWHCKAITDSSVDALKAVTSAVEGLADLLGPKDKAGDSVHAPALWDRSGRP